MVTGLTSRRRYMPRSRYLPARRLYTVPACFRLLRHRVTYVFRGVAPQGGKDTAGRRKRQTNSLRTEREREKERGAGGRGRRPGGLQLETAEVRLSLCGVLLIRAFAKSNYPVRLTVAVPLWRDRRDPSIPDELFVRGSFLIRRMPDAGLPVIPVAGNSPRVTRRYSRR